MFRDGYYNKSTYELVWDLIIEANPRIDYTKDQVRISQMEENIGADRRPDLNTYGKLVAIPGLGREGEQWFEWNRPFMNEIFADIDVFVPPKKQQRVSDLLPDFNAMYGFKLAAGDIYDFNIEILDTPKKYTIQIRETCPAFQGTLDIWLGLPYAPIQELITNPDLDGLEYPTKQSVRIQGPLYLYGRDFTYCRRLLESEFGYDSFVTEYQAGKLADQIFDPWVYSDTPSPFNWKGARVVYNGTTADCPAPCNQQLYASVLMIEVDTQYNTNVAGHVNFHYDRIVS